MINHSSTMMNAATATDPVLSVLHRRVQEMELLLGLYDTTSTSIITTESEAAASSVGGATTGGDTGAAVGSIGSESTTTNSNSHTKRNNNTSPLIERISALEQHCSAVKITTNNINSNDDDDDDDDDWNVIQQHVSSLLYHENSWNDNLNPGTALTHQQQHVATAPIIYRKQEIIASADRYHENLQQVHTILNLLFIGQTPSSSSSLSSSSRSSNNNNNNNNGNNTNSRVTEEQVVNAPIIVPTSTTSMTPEQMQHLDILTTTITDLQYRVQIVTNQLDQMMDQYGILISNISELMIVLMEESIQNESNTSDNPV